VGYVGSLTHFSTFINFPTFHWKWLFPNNYHIANWRFSFHDLQSPHYGALWIDLHIFFTKVLIKCPSKGFPITFWELLLKLVITLKLYSNGHFYSLLLHHVMPTYSFTTTCNVFLVVFYEHLVCFSFLFALLAYVLHQICLHFSYYRSTWTNHLSRWN